MCHLVLEGLLLRNWHKAVVHGSKHATAEQCVYNEQDTVTDKQNYIYLDDYSQ